MSRSSYMPAKESEQVQWSNTFAHVVSENAAAYGVPAATAAAFSAVNDALQAAWATAMEPSTRTRSCVAAKNNALAAMRQAAKNVVSLIQGTPTVTDQMKIDAGVTVRKTKPTRAKVPGFEPFIKVEQIKGRLASIVLQQDKSKRSKPVGVVSATIFIAMSEEAPLTLEGWTFLTTTGKTKLDIPFPASTTGDTAWVTAFWTNSAQESGPAATPVRINLPAGGVLAKDVEEPMKLRAA